VSIGEILNKSWTSNIYNLYDMRKGLWWDSIVSSALSALIINGGPGFNDNILIMYVTCSKKCVLIRKYEALIQTYYTFFWYVLLRISDIAATCLLFKIKACKVKLAAFIISYWETCYGQTTLFCRNDTASKKLIHLLTTYKFCDVKWINS
jgi:hypothetical protein